MVPRAIGRYRVVRALAPSEGMGRDAYLALVTPPPKLGPGEPPSHAVLRLIETRDPRAAQVHRDLERCPTTLRHRALVPVEAFEHGSHLVVAFPVSAGPRLEDIQRHLEQKGARLSDAAIWHIGFEVLGALARAHNACDRAGRLVHGHLGPDRVHVSWTGEVRIIGIGLPELFDDEGRSEWSLAFRAPESAVTPAPTARSDAYVAAAMLWSLLTGRPPPPSGLPRARLTSARADLPARIAAAIDGALVKEPAHRTISCMHLAHLLTTDIQGAGDSRELRSHMEVLRGLQSAPADPTAAPWAFQLGAESTALPDAFGESVVRRLDDLFEEVSPFPVALACDTAPPSGDKGPGVVDEIGAPSDRDEAAFEQALSETAAADDMPPEAPATASPSADAPPGEALEPLQEDTHPPVVWGPGVRGVPAGPSPRRASTTRLALAAASFVGLCLLAALLVLRVRDSARDEDVAPAAADANASATATISEETPPRSTASFAAPQPSASVASSRAKNDAPDAADLPAREAYLVVRSHALAEVLVHGNPAGMTNQTLRVPCRYRNLRLRDPATMKWLTAGEAVDIPCRSTTTITVEPQRR